jgi:hypothetical protein
LAALARDAVVLAAAVFRAADDVAAGLAAGLAAAGLAAAGFVAVDFAAGFVAGRRVVVADLAAVLRVPAGIAADRLVVVAALFCVPESVLLLLALVAAAMGMFLLANDCGLVSA